MHLPICLLHCFYCLEDMCRPVSFTLTSESCIVLNAFTEDAPQFSRNNSQVVAEQWHLLYRSMVTTAKRLSLTPS